MRYGEIPGVGKRMSRLVMGVDNQPDLAHASAIFDLFVEQGGNVFDTGYIYGGGVLEGRLGRWIQNRGIREDVVVITKGAHTPYCDPESLTRQLLESLERQGTDYADIYMMHRDNPDIPVGEFVDVLDEHRRAGRIRVYGGSNWTPARFDEANAYARANGKHGFEVLSNHFGLAEAYDVPWDGCEHATDAGIEGLARGAPGPAAAVVVAGPRLLHRPRDARGHQRRRARPLLLQRRQLRAAPACARARRAVRRPRDGDRTGVRAQPAVPDVPALRTPYDRGGPVVHDAASPSTSPRNRWHGWTSAPDRPRRPGGRATIIDVAAAAGVSRQTVTRAMNGMSGISAATKDRVLQAAAALDYRPSRFGRGLVTGGDHQLGLVVNDLRNPYAPAARLRRARPGRRPRVERHARRRRARERLGPDGGVPRRPDRRRDRLPRVRVRRSGSNGSARSRSSSSTPRDR